MSTTTATTARAPARALHPTLRVVERNLHVFRVLWRTSLFMHFVTPLLFLAAMGLGVGGLVDARNGSVDGVSYLQFVTPGLLAGFAMQSTAMNATWGVLAHTKWIGSYQAQVASPLGPSDIFGGLVVYSAIRAGIQAAAFLAAALVVGGLASWWSILAIPAAMVGSTAFSAPLASWAVLQHNDVGISVVLRVGIMPLFMLSGTFFPIHELPDWLEPLAWLSPLFHLVELCRGATTGSIDPLAAVAHVAVLLACAGLGWRAGVRTFARRLTP